jgi:hypothetical protein
VVAVTIFVIAPVEIARRRRRAIRAQLAGISWTDVVAVRDVVDALGAWEQTHAASIAQILAEAHENAGATSWRMKGENAHLGCRWVRGFSARRAAQSVHVTLDLAPEQGGRSVWRVKLTVTREVYTSVDVRAVQDLRR